MEQCGDTIVFRWDSGKETKATCTRLPGHTLDHNFKGHSTDKKAYTLTWDAMAQVREPARVPRKPKEAMAEAKSSS